jgi:hypothetical protein
MISAAPSPSHPDSGSPAFAEASPDTRVESDRLEWTVFLMRERPEKTFGVALGFLLVLAWSALSFHTLLVGLVGCVALLGAVKEYLLPLRYRVDSEGATVLCCGITWIELPWREVRSVYRAPAGLKLSPHADPARARTENLRGLTLRFKPEMAGLVEAAVAGNMRRARSESGSR